MGTTAFDPDSSTNGMPETGSEAPQNRVSGPEARAQAVADLLRQKSLTSTFGDHGEWEVRTTLVTNRQAWRYQSRVFLQGKERKKGFPRIAVDRTRDIRQTGTVTEELLAAFAGEAAEIHVARCESVQEYLTMAPFFAQTRPRYDRTKQVAVVLLSVAALMTAYWWWRDFDGQGLEQPDRQPQAHSLQWHLLQVSHQYPAGEPFELPLPGLERRPGGIPVQVTLAASDEQPPGWLQLDPERLHLRGTAPPSAANQTYRLTIRAHTAQGSESRLLVLLTITGQPQRNAPERRFPGHWTW